MNAPALSLSLVVNGTSQTVTVPPRMTLAELLRGPLDLTGTKIACNTGACGACTIWLDGEPVCACTLLAADAHGREITTIEGLAKGGRLHAVQRAFIEHDAMQCGFCTPGFVMSCAGLLARNPHPSLEDVKAALSGHICRCGSYPKICEATLAATDAKDPDR